VAAARRPFRFGIVTAHARSAAEWVGKARRAEALGYSTLLMPDTLGPTLTAIPALGVLAGATSTLRLGTFVLANDFRNPVLLAREAATLDLLSGGRFELGLGAGRPGAAEDNRKLGIPFDPGGVRVRRLAEALDVIAALLAGETVTAPGPHYAAVDADPFPRPVQQPRPPIMVAASGPRLLALAARKADIVAIGAGPTEGEAGLRDRVEHVRRAAPDRFPDLELNMNLFAVGNDVHPTLVARMGMDPAELLRLRSPLVLRGSPDEMADQLRSSRETFGVSYISVADAFMEACAPVVERLAGR
jgi:probable F420-dependent oxidoreductase